MNTKYFMNLVNMYKVNRHIHISEDDLNGIQRYQVLSYVYQLPVMHHLNQTPEYDVMIPYLFLFGYNILFYKSGQKAIFLTNMPVHERKIQTSYKGSYQLFIIDDDIFLNIKDVYYQFYRMFETLQKLHLNKKSKVYHTYHHELLHRIIETSTFFNVSDIHFVKVGSMSHILIRLHGKRINILELSHEIMDHLLRKMKVLANIEINNHSSAQDGMFQWHEAHIQETFRLATMPTIHGEQMILRKILKESAMQSLDVLGISNEQITYLQQQLEKKQGLILVSGSTGSGKTTTLYACLKQLKQKPIHIVTLEDPVEIYMDHISQITLSNHQHILKHVMRYDPDVIMIGEIRDDMTASVAIEAALSGHLVLASIHVNHPKDIFKRLQQFRVKSDIVKETSPMMMHHHLIPLLCQRCKGKGCIHCMFQGYNKRQLILDILHYNEHTWQQKGDEFTISLNTLKNEGRIDLKTYQAYQL